MSAPHANIPIERAKMFLPERLLSAYAEENSLILIRYANVPDTIHINM